MADLSPLGFDPETTEDMGDGFKVVPPNTYNVVIVESDVLNTTKRGKMLVLKYQIIDGQYVGDHIIDRINIVNSSDMAQKIGRSQLKNICDAVGHAGKLMDSNQLHGKPLTIKVVIEEFESNKEAGKMLKSNKVEKRMPKKSASTTTSAQQSSTSDAGATPPKQAMAW